MADHKQDRDLGLGVPIADFEPTGLVAGQCDGDAILLVRMPDGVRAVAATCSHKGAPLVKGVLAGGTLRCPWHHACFDPTTGAALAAPALRALDRWSVTERDGMVHVGRRLATLGVETKATLGRIVIVGAGAAGAAAADALAGLGYGAATTLLGNETEEPYDRTMLSKHLLAGTAGEDDLPLAMAGLETRGVDVRRGVVVTSIEPEGKRVHLADGTALPFAKLILATGAEPRRLTVPGAELPHVHVLRSVADARAIIAALAEAPRVVIAGSSFIGLEVAAALRDRDLAVTVVSPEQEPFVATLGPELAEAITGVHRERGTAFRLGRQITRIEPAHVVLDDGSTVVADLVIVGIGVSPRTTLAAKAGLRVDDGVIVDERLRTSDRDIYAVGDIARWPDPHGGTPVRIEHWAVAERQGQIAAANAVGHNLRYDVVPFFWTMHFDYSVRVVGHASGQDERRVEGDPSGRDAAVHFMREGRAVAVATVERDRVALQVEVDMERRLGGPAALLPA